MNVCARCCLATVIAAVVLLVPQFEANPIDTSAPSSSPLPKATDTKETAAKTSETDVLGETSIKEKLGQDTDQNKIPPNEDPVIPRISVAASSKSAPDTQHSVLTQGSVSQDSTTQDGAAGTNVVSEPPKPSDTDTSAMETKNENSEAKIGIPRISVAANDKVSGEEQNPAYKKSPVESAGGNVESAPPHESSQASIAVSDPTGKKAEVVSSDSKSEIRHISVAANTNVRDRQQSATQNNVPDDPTPPGQAAPLLETPQGTDTVRGTTAKGEQDGNSDGTSGVPRISAADNAKVPEQEFPVMSQATASVPQDGPSSPHQVSQASRTSAVSDTSVKNTEATSEVSSVVIKTDQLATKVQDNKAGATLSSQDDQLSHNKGKLPKINAAVEEMIKPAALPSPASTQVNPVPGSEHSQIAEGTKVEERPASSDLPEEPGHQPTSTIDQTKSKVDKQDEGHVVNPAKEEPLQAPPASSDQPRKGEGKEGLIARSSGPAPSNDHSLTTIITPVHTIAQGASSSPVGAESPSVSETHTNTNPNAYTITPNEFAQKTAVVHAQQTEEKNKEATETASGDISNKHGPDIESGKGQAVIDPENGLEETLKNNKGITSDPNKSNTQAGNTNGINSNAEKSDQLQEVSHDIVEDKKSQPSSAAVASSDLKALSSLVDEITNEIEAYSTETAEFWNERKKKISWLSEASDVLQNYNDKITETEKYSKKCTTDERKKYHERKNLLESLINNCERSLKREVWNDLQGRIKTKLDEIRTVNADANVQISKIPKEEEHFNERKLVIEDIAKRKLRDLFTESDKTSLSDLKDKALTQDEEDYKQCIDSKETEDKGRTGIISETMSDIMKIKDCSDAMFT